MYMFFVILSMTHTIDDVVVIGRMTKQIILFYLLRMRRGFIYMK